METPPQVRDPHPPQTDPREAPLGTNGAVSAPVLRWSRAAGPAAARESLVVEEPLALEIGYPADGRVRRRQLAITLRTPGHDLELALGFLLAEGLVRHAGDVVRRGVSAVAVTGERIDTVWCELAHDPGPAAERAARALVHSGCGLCGRNTLSGLPLPPVPEGFRLAPEVILELPGRLRACQEIFRLTGGCHGAALCDLSGRVRVAREDVGRHNAVDKVFGAALLEDIPRRSSVLVLSGRAGFELVQKAAAGGVPLVVSVGAPSTGAVELARDLGLTLAGFVRDGRFNLYTEVSRIQLEENG